MSASHGNADPGEAPVTDPATGPAADPATDPATDPTTDPAAEPTAFSSAAGDDAHVAVVDLGSNSVRLVVYDRLSRAPFPRFNEKSLCRLGASFDADGNLGEKAMDDVVAALERFAAIARAMEVGEIELLATEAIRKAGNGEAFRARLEAASGLTVRILSGDDEARFAAMGVISGAHEPSGLVGDLGGGSLEIAEIRGKRVGEGRVSLPLGALRVVKLIEEEGAKTARKRIDAVLREELPEVVPGADFNIVGGGWRAIAKIHLANAAPPVPVIHGLELGAEELRELAKSLAAMDAAELEEVKGAPGRRISTLPAAALVMDRVLKHLEPGRVLFSSLGVREGWLYELLSEEERARDPLIAGCRQLAAESARVPAFAAALERWTEGLFIGENGAQRRLRVAATALSDLAWRDARDVQATLVFERILRFPFIGITHAERAFLAATVHARYGKRAEHEALALLDEDEADRAHVLGTAMLLGYRFSGSVPEILDHASIGIDADTVTLSVDEATSVPDSEAVQARLSLLAKALGRSKTAVVARRS